MPEVIRSEDKEIVNAHEQYSLGHNFSTLPYLWYGILAVNDVLHKVWFPLVKWEGAKKHRVKDDCA